MRRQWPCSKCGFACASTRRNSNSLSGPVICSTCRTKGGKEEDIPNYPRIKQVGKEAGAKVNPSSDDQISPATSIVHENVGLISINQIGMIFGNLPFEPTLAIPIGKSQDAKVKIEVFTAEDNPATGAQHPTNSVLGGSRIKIKQEYDSEQTISEAPGKESFVWDTNRVQKKKRSKLPQYTLSPLARFINQLQQVSRYGGRPYDKAHKSTAAANREKEKEGPKYDDVLIYEKCKYVPENEIGLGAKLLSPVVSSTKSGVVMIKEEPSEHFNWC